MEPESAFASMPRAEQVRALETIAKRVAAARRDPAEFAEVVFHSEHGGQQPIKLAPHQRLMLRFVQLYAMCVVRMPVGSSKCVAADTLVVDGMTGLRRPVAEAVRGFTALGTWSEQDGVHVAPITAAYDTGTKQCLMLRTRTGRVLKVTPEHKMLTPAGWVRADALRVGDTLAAAERVNHPLKPVEMLDAEVDLLALLLAEGCTTVRASFSTGDQKILDLAEAAAARLGCQVKHRDKYDYNFVGAPRWRGNKVVELIKRHGLFGCKTTNKQIPDAIFRLPARQLARFITVFWQCDGFVDDKTPAITLANEKMIDQLRHLLLRFGVKTQVHKVVTSCDGKKGEAWRCAVRADSMAAFAASFHLWEYKRKRLLACLAKWRNPNLGMPRLRAETTSDVCRFVEGLKSRCTRVRGRKRTWKELLFTKGLVGQQFRSASQTNFELLFEREPAARARFGWWFESGLDWDELIAIEDAGECRVFDFTMQPTACFLANDLVAHNTFLLSVFGMWMLGKDLTTRGAVVSAAQAQAEKPLKLMMEYIAEKRQLELVFPNLRKSGDPAVPWSKNKFSVRRPQGIRDPSMVAFGINGKIPGARLSWVFGDDMLSAENTRTKEQRTKLTEDFNTTVVPRLDPVGRRCVVTNTPWDRDDITYRLERLGWPTITMSVEGWISFGGRLTEDEIEKHFGDLVRPSRLRAGKWRLRAFDPDEEEATLLWPDRYPPEWYAWERANTLPHAFARSYLCEPMSSEAARCLREWVDAAEAKGLGQQFPSPPVPGNPCCTGVDIGGVKNNNDLTSICTISLLPDGKRQIMNLQSGRWHAAEMMSRIIAEAQRYDSDVYIESNAAQTYIADFTELFAEKKPNTNGVRVHRFNTGRNKYDAEFGVEAVFTEMMRGLWVWPSRQPSKELQELADECLFYNPEQHTGDRLMALFLARQGLNRPGRNQGAGSGRPRVSAVTGGSF